MPATDLPTAVALAENLANPISPLLGACLLVWDGSAWDRAPGTSGEGLDVDTELPAAAALADSASNPTTPTAGACAQEFNGTTWDRRRGNADVTVFTSAARTETANSSDVTNYNGRGARLTLDITAVAGTAPTLDVKMQAKDALSGKYVDIAGAAFTQKITTGTDELIVYPGVAETANESVSDIIPRVFRAVATIGGVGPSFTFSLGASLIT